MPDQPTESEGTDSSSASAIDLPHNGTLEPGGIAWASGRLHMNPIAREKDRASRVLMWLLIESFLMFSVTAVVGLAALGVFALAPTIFDSLSRTHTPVALAITAIGGAMAVKLWSIGVGEALQSMVSAVDHIVVRTVSVVVVGTSEALGTGEAGAQLLYSFVVVGTCALSILFCVYVLGDFTLSSPSVLEITRAPLTFSSFSRAVWFGFQLGMGMLLTALAIRMMFSAEWASMLRRVSFVVVPRSSDLKRVPAPLVTLRIAHASDLHAQIAGHRLSEGRTLNEGDLAYALEEISRTNNVDAVVLSGDLTEDGSHDAWDALLSTDALYSFKERLVIAPGNHDLNSVYADWRASVFRISGSLDVEGHGRALRYLNAANELMGERTTVICPFTGAVSTFSEVMERARDDLAGWAADRATPRSRYPADILAEIFPMVVRVGEESSPTRFVVWNSVKPNRWPVLNAIGAVSRSQIDRMDKMLVSLGQRPLVHIVHHQIGLPRSSEAVDPKSKSLWSRFSSAFMALESSHALVDWLIRRRQRTVILHGHHHKLFAMRQEDCKATIVSAPSATLGCEESFVSGEHCGTRGRWLLLSVAVGRGVADLQGFAVRDSFPSQRPRG